MRVENSKSTNEWKWGIIIIFNHAYICLSAHQRYEWRNITYYNIRTTYLHNADTTTIQTQNSTDPESSSSLSSRYRCYWNMHELTSLLVMVKCFALHISSYDSIENSVKIHIFNFSSLDPFISFHFHLIFFHFLIFLFLVQWKHSNPLCTRSQLAHLFFSHFDSKLNFSSRCSTSHTNWKCFQNGILLLIFLPPFNSHLSSPAAGCLW